MTPAGMHGTPPQQPSQSWASKNLAAGGLVIEMLVRLGVALFLSLGLAVLLAWGWDSSDDHPTPSQTPFTASDSVALLR